MKDNKKKKEITLELIISYILVAGVILSLVIISYGLIQYYITTGKTSPHFTSKWQIGGTDFFSYITNLNSYFTTSLFASNPIRIMALNCFASNNTIYTCYCLCNVLRIQKEFQIFFDNLFCSNHFDIKSCYSLVIS
jgi:uncharacterized membrane protein